MTDHLAGDALLAHVRALAADIGPRPPVSPAEAEARQYIRSILAGIEVEELHFSTVDTWGYSLLAPVLLALGGNIASV